MRKHSSHRNQVAALTVLFVLSLIAAGLSQGPTPSHALPIYARRYNVTCDTCHSVAPRLNSFGLAFQANHFNWPGGNPPAHQTGLGAFPISGLATFSQSRFQGSPATPADFQTLELYVSDGFRLGGLGRGGYFLDDFGATNDVRAGNLENAFVSLPVAGKRGEWALTAGQFTPLAYQYDALNSLTQSLPAALADSVDAFSPTDANPGVRLEYFNNQGGQTADGDYLTVGVPFLGHLRFNSDSRLYGPHGVFVQGFRRHGATSLGFFGYDRSDNNLEGIIGTLDLRPDLTLLGVAALGHDFTGNTRHLSLEMNYVPLSQVAVTARLEALGGNREQDMLYPVAGVTYYPFHQSVLRLTGETIQQKGSRSTTVYAFVQF